VELLPLIREVCQESGMTHVILDGTLIECDRVVGVRESGNDLWFSRKHKAFGGNVQFLAAPDGTPLRVSEVEPGSTPDITAARIHVLPALYRAAAEGLPTRPVVVRLHSRRAGGRFRQRWSEGCAVQDAVAP
jgi:hypothetical protein